MNERWKVEILPHEGFGIELDGEYFDITDENAQKLEDKLNRAEELGSCHDSTAEKDIYHITEALENIIFVPLSEDEVLKIIEYFKSRDKTTEGNKTSWCLIEFNV